MNRKPDYLGITPEAILSRIAAPVIAHVTALDTPAKQKAIIIAVTDILEHRSCLLPLKHTTALRCLLYPIHKHIKDIPNHPQQENLVLLFLNILKKGVEEVNTVAQTHLAERLKKKDEEAVTITQTSLSNCSENHIG